MENHSGKPGDFAFLTGEWAIRHRRLVDGQWDDFKGEASVISMLDGLASVEELRIPSRGFSGMGLRLLDVQRGLWADYWINSQSGVPACATWGSFRDGAGVWEERSGSVVTRGVWDQITPDSCRWHQAVSHDAGSTWAENWIMHWARVR